MYVPPLGHVATSSCSSSSSLKSYGMYVKQDLPQSKAMASSCQKGWLHSGLKKAIEVQDVRLSTCACFDPDPTLQRRVFQV